MFQMDFKIFLKPQPKIPSNLPPLVIFSINAKEQRNLNYNGENYRNLGQLTQINFLLPPNQFAMASYFAGNFNKRILMSQI